MRLTSFTDFGLRALMRIASEPDRTHSTADIAEEFEISRNHLTKAIAALAAAGFVQTLRGTGGGARLARPAEEMGLGDIIAALEHRTVIVECFAPDGGSCVITPVCRLKGILASAQLRFISDLNRFTLADCSLPARQVDQYGDKR